VSSKLENGKNPLNTESTAAGLQQMRSEAHANCVVCSSANERSLRLEFVESDAGEVRALFDCTDAFEGYAGRIHGGVVASLVDGAMTNCLFAHGVSAVTVELNVRFRHPVVTGKVAMVRAWVERSTTRLYVVKAEIVQDRQNKATALGKFMKNVPLSNEGLPEG
jgi:uncharacterized protein (TIGR00369 family)